MFLSHRPSDSQRAWLETFLNDYSFATGYTLGTTTLSDRIEMLHFRCSTVLKELFEVTLKRPLSGSRQKSWLPTRCSSVDASLRLKVLHAAPHRPGLRTAPCAAPFRSYCTKTEGAVEPDEQLKKDGVSREASIDK